MSTMMLSFFLILMALLLQSGACCDNTTLASSQIGYLMIPYPTPDYNTEQPTAYSCRFTAIAELSTGQSRKL